MITKSKILVVDDDTTFLKSISKLLEMYDFEVTTTETPMAALELINDTDFDIMLTDVKMPGMNGIELQKEAMKTKPQMPVIAISGQSNIPIAIEMIKNGAYEFLEKPVDDEKLLTTINNAIEKKEIVEANVNLYKELEEQYRMVGSSAHFKSLIEQIKIIAPTEARVLLTGDTGTGKELVAWALHHNSRRKGKPYLKINCASIPSELLEAELFGFKKGAFTGADRDRVGKFVAANGGTLFLDEVGELEYSLQSKLLRVLEENEVEIIGENVSKKIDVRIIAATNRNLIKEIENKKFREDLFHRLNVVQIHLPPLIERKEDILPLAEHFIKMFNEIYNKKAQRISKQLEGILLNNEWKGNIRELKNTIEKLVIFSSSEELTVNDYYKAFNSNHPAKKNSIPAKSLRELKDNFEKEILLDALTKHDWKVSETAKTLGIERSNLFKKMKKYNIRNQKRSDNE